ncbi:hypothetical protein JTB14_025025 [Gonioctena quinquepunctata]|nr:hypothetical protein JTB14_025025 [Gonioctena quinquepunctata]
MVFIPQNGTPLKKIIHKKENDEIISIDYENDAHDEVENENIPNPNDNIYLDDASGRNELLEGSVPVEENSQNVIVRPGKREIRNGRLWQAMTQVKVTCVFIQVKKNQSVKDHCLYLKCSNFFVLNYEDDLLILGTNMQEVDDSKIILNTNFCMEDLGLISQYLGINVKQNLVEKHTELSQEDYLKKVLKMFGMQDCKPVNIPIDVNTDFNFKNTHDDSA